MQAAPSIAQAAPAPCHHLHRYSEDSLLLTVAHTDVQAGHALLQAMVQQLAIHGGGLLQEVVVAYQSALLVLATPQDANAALLTWPALLQQVAVAQACTPLPPIDIPVCYHPALGHDLEAVAAHLQLNISTLIDLHSASTYQVFMLGFLPGFAYMGMLPPQLHMARKASPVPTRAGAVAIAGAQTGIYPLDSPGGWHVLGYTPLPMWMPQANPPVRLQAGAQVRFVPIGLEDYHQLKSAAYDGGA